MKTPRRGRKGEVTQGAAKAPRHLATTLYDVMAALQSVVEPDEDDLVVEVVMRWRRTGRITLVGNATVAA